MDTIENPPNEDVDDSLPDAFINVVLSFNQHFTGERCNTHTHEKGEYISQLVLECVCSSDPDTNLVMKVLKTKNDPRHFSEKFMFLINRGGEPIVINLVLIGCPTSHSPFSLPLNR